MEKHKNGTNDPRLDKKMPEIIAAVKAHNIPEVRRLVESCGLEWLDDSFHQYDIKEAVKFQKELLDLESDRNFYTERFFAEQLKKSELERIISVELLRAQVAAYHARIRARRETIIKAIQGL